jgi:hypothetical protein
MIIYYYYYYSLSPLYGVFTIIHLKETMFLGYIMFKLFYGYNLRYMSSYFTPMPVAAPSKAWAYGCSLAGIAGLIPAGDMDVCLLLVLCVVKQRSLRRTDHSSGGVPPTVVCLSVIEEPQRGGLGPLGLSSHEKKKSYFTWQTLFTLVPSVARVQCPIWLLSVLPWCRAFQVICSRIFWMISRCFQPLLLLLVSILFIHSTCDTF